MLLTRPCSPPLSSAASRLPQHVRTMLMPFPPGYCARILGFLPVLLLAFGLVCPVNAFGQNRRIVNSQALADSLAYRIATFTPTSGPPGTVVTVHWQRLPALTPVRLGVGALHVGFESLKEILTDQSGEFTDTIVIPQWARSNRAHSLLVQDFYFRPLALSTNFLVTDPDGTLSREGRMTAGTNGCAGLVGEEEERYNLIGDVQGLELGVRVIARGTLADPSTCGEGKDVTIQITNIRRGIGG